MNNTIDYLGKSELAFSHFRCPCCWSWFRFDYDRACKTIKNHGVVTIGCPNCDYNLVETDVSRLPDRFITFKDVD